MSILWLFLVWWISLPNGIRQVHCFPEANLINRLNGFYRFDHNLFVMESSLVFDEICDIPSPSFVPQTLYVINDNISDIKMWSNRTSGNTLMIICLTSTELQQNLNFLSKIKDYQQFNSNMKIGLFLTWPLSVDHLLQLFKWYWQHSIFKIFIGYPSSYQLHKSCLEYSLIVYTFNPFGTFELINLTDSESVANHFPKICYNLRQHPIRIAVHNDINTFIYSKANPNFGGSDGKLWQTIFRAINASYTVVQYFEITDGFTIPEMALNGTIDLAPQTFKVNNMKPMYLYPIYMDTVVIVVPSALPYSEFTEYLQTFSGDSTFIIFLLTIAVLIGSLTFIRYVKRRKFLFVRSVTDIFNLFMSDNTSINYPNLFRAECYVILPSTLAGFVIINILLSLLTSYLTRPMDQPELNTFDDIERSPFSVIAPSKKNMEQLIVILKHNFNIDWRHKMAYLELRDYFQQILSFNASFCFVYLGSKVKNLFEHQKRLNIRGFRIPRQTISQTVFAYPVPVDNPLKDCFNEIIHRVMNGGLYWKWTDESYVEFVEKGLFSGTHGTDADQRGAEKYYVPIFIVYGWTGSVVVFIMEIFWNRMSSRNV